ncbi:MAG: DUF4279 domain-containing protein [Flavobacterium nitrogenifigens]|uniref:DUF4279 domain-containing protein n=1 Tax=Flavobacterium nitrogenifigens TaxID=1617283 RepID=UPI0028091955|nr:DUF4279 domain-containing protein [Flavobacterium nitrogenifigens]MDQ8015103.1 DUF4279 domain-containing protein [Flavobacterium nitrogenifigens]MDQ8054295.1 DUF4279 domain-containing protein [Pedobacter sp.]
MTDKEIKEVIEEEFRSKTFGLTEQFLEIHSPIYFEDNINIARIDREEDEGLVIAYLPVSEEPFYFAVYIDTESKQIFNIGSESWNRVYFRAHSEIKTEDELKSLTELKPTKSWNKGDLRENKKMKEKVSYIEFLPNPEPDEFEDKLKKLLDFLEKDEAGIKKLVETAEGYIQVAMDIHNGNGMIGGPTINKDSISRMSNLGLEINFDMYVGGNSFK